MKEENTPRQVSKGLFFCKKKKKNIIIIITFRELFHFFGQ